MRIIFTGQSFESCLKARSGRWRW